MENNPALKTLVVASHESSATGAPLLGLNVARAFGAQFNIVHIVTTKSDLHEEFRKHCEMFIYGVRGAGSKSVLRRLKQQRDVYAVICNSVETHDTLIAASELGLPTVCLVHEFADYTRPIGRMSRVVLRADQVIVPAAVVKESISSELRELHGIDKPPANVRVLTQGKLPWLPGNRGDDESADDLRQKLGISSEAGIPVIAAGGAVHIRKGVDLYVALAQQIRRKYSSECRFLWVGSGYDPSNDMGYSFWIKKQVELSGLADSMSFLDYQKSLDKVFAIADVFCLTSRMDPFPNIVIDALSHDIHIACFRDGTGCGDFLLENGADCTVVDHLDLGMMADGIIEYLNRPSRSSVRNSELVRDKLNFSKYLRALEEVMDAAHAAHE
jgi:glycosyltransferase involved in cell wall biosynthesis